MASLVRRWPDDGVVLTARWVAQVAASTLIRRVVGLLLVAVLGWLSLGDARADETCNNVNVNSGTCDSGSEAVAQATAYAWARSSDARDTICPAVWINAQGASTSADSASGVKVGLKRFQYSETCPSVAFIGTRWFPPGCPAGRTRNAQTGTCDLGCPGGYAEDPYNAGQCMDNDKCQALNSGLGTGRRSWTQATKCAGGCLAKLDDQRTTTVTSTGEKLFNGVARYTGEACPTNPAPPAATPEQVKETKPQECVTPSGTQETVCVKATGEKCHKSKAGKQHCWQPGETGTKTDEETLQKTDAGPNVIIPNLNLPNGDTLTKQGTSVTTTVHNTTNNTTITTTTTNYKTTNGTSTGTPKTDTGEKGDGTSKTPGDGDKDGNSTGGSGECGAGWLPTGDAILAASLTEQHKARCRDEQSDKDAKTDATTLGAAADALASEFDPDSLFQEGENGDGLNTSFLSLGGGACPNLTFNLGPAGTFTAPPLFCDLVLALALLFQLGAYVWGLRIVMD